MGAIKLVLSFALKDGRFSICATVKGTTKRNYKEVKNLVNPNFSVWDSKSQMFNEMSDSSMMNNRILFEMKNYYQRIIDDKEPESGKALFSYPDFNSKFVFKQPEIVQESFESSGKSDKLTLGGFLVQLIEEMRHDNIKVPSKNYQNYITFLHKLEIEGNIINVPLEDIDDNHYEKFGKFVLQKLRGVNYIGLMKRFHTTIAKAKIAKLTRVVLCYPYAEFAPKRKADFSKAIDGVSVLTESQYKKFLKMDLSKIHNFGPQPTYHMELYRDFCVFLYEMKMRPCDVMLLKSSDFRKGVMSIINKKKANYRNTQLAIQTNPLTPKAKEIIEKYKGKSSKGYVFPFAMNEYDWDIYDSESYAKWHNRKQATFELINKFLKRVQVILGVEDTITLYTFRHSAFTHEINTGKKSVLQIAKEGGTSIDMLEHHYYNHIKK